MKLSFAPLLALVLALALAACATMNKDECRSADWRARGVEDGAKGWMVSNIGQYREACARHGITPNLEEYQAGHAIGARTFCTPTNGFSRGRAGADGYENFCPQDVAKPFVAAYERGRMVYAADQRLSQAQKSLASLINEVDALDESIIDSTGLISANDTPTAERVRLAKELVEMGNRRSALNTERPRRERAVSSAEADLARVLREVGQ